MIRIGKSYIVHEKTETCLCADIIVDCDKFTLWFSVDFSQGDYLYSESSDAFVVAILFFAMREAHEIVCEGPLSARLHYQLENYLIPALAFAKKSLHVVHINADVKEISGGNCRAVGTAFSNDMDFYYTIERHGNNCEYPMTHITVFNTGGFEEYQCKDKFREKCQQALDFAHERNLQCIFVDTNLYKELYENYMEVSSFFNVACVLALQGLFSVFIFSTEYEAACFKLEIENAACYDLLTLGCVSTESLSFYLSGAEVNEYEKGQVMSKHNIHTSVPNLNVKSRKDKRRRYSFFKRKREDVSDVEENVIKIGKPYIEEVSNNIRLCANVELRGQRYVMWFAVKKEYGEYLMEDRTDAFVVALLTTAMHEAQDIICEGSITRRLMYQLNHYLIPMMASNMHEFRFIRIYAEPTDEIIECAGAVATGWTGGVDSMFTYMKNVHKCDYTYKMTHLFIANNGAITGDTRETFRRMIEKTEKGFAAEAELKVIGVDTNLQEIMDENFLAVVGFRHAAVILALQKLFHVFMESSTYSFSEFSFHAENMAYYEMVVLNCLETDNTIFYSSGGVFSRVQKLEELSVFPLAQRYLHPCIYALRDKLLFM